MRETMTGGRQILVVDDSQVVTRSLMALLRTEGFEPVIFQTGQPALDFIRDNCPDAALLDVHLPDVSGLEISRTLRQTHGKDLPIFIVSGDSSIDMLKALPDAGATFFFSKPVNASYLLECIKSRLTASA